MCDLKEVVVIKAGVNALVQLVVRNRMEHFRVHPAAVITVDDFTHKPEIRFHGSGLCTHFLHEIKVQDIGCVQTDAVNVKFVHPETDHIKKIIFYLLVIKI